MPKISKKSFLKNKKYVLKVVFEFERKRTEEKVLFMEIFLFG